MKIFKSVLLFSAFTFMVITHTSCQEETFEPSAETKQRDGAKGLGLQD